MGLLITIADYSYACALKIRSYFLHAPNHPMYEPQAPVTILIPGVYEDWSYFKHVHRLLTKAGHKVLHADRLVGSYGTFEDQAERLTTYINDKQYHVSFVAHSSGGIIALLAAEKLGNQVTSIVTVAAPYSGVLNGHLLRTKLVRQLMPSSATIRNMQHVSADTLKKTILLYPRFDNQVWSRRGSLLKGATNIELDARGHHMVLRSRALLDYLSQTYKL